MCARSSLALWCFRFVFPDYMTIRATTPNATTVSSYSLVRGAFIPHNHHPSSRGPVAVLSVSPPRRSPNRPDHGHRHASSHASTRPCRCDRRTACAVAIKGPAGNRQDWGGAWLPHQVPGHPGGIDLGHQRSGLRVGRLLISGVSGAWPRPGERPSEPELLPCIRP